MPDIRADEPEAREPERLVFGDGEGSAPRAGTARAARVRRDSRAGRAQGPRPEERRSHGGQIYGTSVEGELDRERSRSSELLPERVVIATEFDAFLSLRTLSAYAGLSVRTLRQYLDLAPDQALPCYRVAG